VLNTTRKPIKRPETSTGDTNLITKHSWRALQTNNSSADIAIVFATNDRPINRIATVKGGRPGVPYQRNANLIAAAPDLLAALQLIVEQDLLDPRQSVQRDALNQATTAIATATGATL